MLHENNEFSFAMLNYICCYQEYKAYLGLHIKGLIFLSDFCENLTFSTDFNESPRVKLHENPSSGSCAVPSRWAAGWTF